MRIKLARNNVTKQNHFVLINSDQEYMKDFGFLTDSDRLIGDLTTHSTVQPYGFVTPVILELSGITDAGETTGFAPSTFIGQNRSFSVGVAVGDGEGGGFPVNALVGSGFFVVVRDNTGATGFVPTLKIFGDIYYVTVGDGSGEGLLPVLSAGNIYGCSIGDNTATTGFAPTIKIGAKFFASIGVGEGYGFTASTNIIETTIGQKLTTVIGEGSGAGSIPSLDIGSSVVLAAGISEGIGNGFIAVETIGNKFVAGLGSSVGKGFGINLTIGASVSVVVGIGEGSSGDTPLSLRIGTKLTSTLGSGSGTGLTPTTSTFIFKERLNPLVYDCLSSGTGLANSYGKSWYNLVVADSFTNKELANQSYIVSCRAQMVDAEIREPDKTNADTIDAKYISLGLSAPMRLMPMRQYGFDYQNEQILIYSDANIASFGPVWALDTIDPGRTKVALPPSSSVGLPNQKTTESWENFTLAEVENELEDNGWTLPNKASAISDPGSALRSLLTAGMFRETSKYGGAAKTLVYNGLAMHISNSAWLNALTDLVAANLDDSDVGVDGCVIGFPKFQNFYRLDSSTRDYYTLPGIKPNGTRDGPSIAKFHYWFKHRYGSQTTIPDPWIMESDTPQFQPASGAAHNFDDTYGTDAFEYIVGWVSLITAMAGKMPAGKQLWVDVTTTAAAYGIWASGTRISYRNDFIARFPGYTQQEAQNVFLEHILTGTQVSGVYGLIIPPIEQGGTVDAQHIVVEPEYWYRDNLERSGKNILYAA